jgi:hypothetical protein
VGEVRECVEWTGTGSNANNAYMHTRQADLEKAEKDLAESKQVRV